MRQTDPNRFAIVSAHRVADLSASWFAPAPSTIRVRGTAARVSLSAVCTFEPDGKQVGLPALDSVSASIGLDGSPPPDPAQAGLLLRRGGKPDLAIPVNAGAWRHGSLMGHLLMPPDGTWSLSDLLALMRSLDTAPATLVVQYRDASGRPADIARIPLARLAKGSDVDADLQWAATTARVMAQGRCP